MPVAGTRDDLIRLLLPSVRKIANHIVRQAFRSRRGLAEDIYSAGLEGLVRAAAIYDPSRGAPRAYLEPRIKGAMLDYLRTEDHLSRDHRRKVKASGIDECPPPMSLDAAVSSAKLRGNDVTLLDVVADPEAETPEAAVARWQEAVAFEWAVRTLPPRTQAFLRLYYAEDRTMVEIAAAYDLTESRVCQIIHAAHEAIRAVLGARP